MGVIGFAFWIPFLARMTAIYVAAVLVSSFADKDAARAERGVQTAVAFWFSGFIRISYVLEAAPASSDDPPISVRDILRALGYSVYTVTFWLVLAWLLGWRPAYVNSLAELLVRLL